MSTETMNPQTNGHDRSLHGVRTYRGRNLEELIPQIRNDLGPDAMILRQREGLTGGVGGFFAQRCVEVEAAAMKKVDVYDDETDEDADAELGSSESTPRTEVTPVRDEAPDLAGAYEAFAARLEQAAAQVDDVSELLEAAAVPPEAVADPVSDLGASLRESSSRTTAGRPDQARPDAERAEPAGPVPPGIPARRAEAEADPEAEIVVPERTASPEPEPEPELVAVPEPEPIATPEPHPVAEPEPKFVATPEPEPVAEPEPKFVATPEPEPVAAPALPPAQRAWTAKQACNVDPAEAAAVVDELTSQGISQAWAEELITAAAAHRLPLMPGGRLRDAVRATLASTIPAPAPLPATGAAVAFVGAGGSGKTRCAAALAAAYSRAGTLAAGVVSLGCPDWGAELRELLNTNSVWVTAAARRADAEPTVTGLRDGGLAVIDTAPVTPGDESSVQALAAELEPLVPDAVYIAVPATFSVHAARKLLDGLEPLGADGIAVTHADEADQLGIAAELAYLSGMPIAYVNEGVDLDRALSAADPASLAARLLP